jgi:prepilin-type N-terminal cleavage/methylation domain-containing protein
MRKLDAELIKKPNRRGQSGFTLLETAIAMVVLAVGLIALGQLVTVAINQNAMSRSTSVGISVAQGKLEELRTAYNRGLENGTSEADLAAGTHAAVVVSLPSGYGTATRDFDVSWTVTDMSATEKTVQVTVQPRQGNFLNSRSVSITSHFAP